MVRLLAISAVYFGIAAPGTVGVIMAGPNGGTTVTWDRQAFGQEHSYPCSPGTFDWPNDNDWDQQEVISVDNQCDPPQDYVSQPSNWDTSTYPNGPGVDVILTAPTAPTSLDIAVTLNSLTVQSGAGNVNMTSGSSFDVQIYDFQTDGSFTTSLNHGHGGATPVITVAGTFKKSAGAGILDISGENSGGDTYFNMAGGTVEVDSGTLRLSRGESTGATFTIAANAAVDLTNGSGFVFWHGAYDGTGAGAVQLNNGGLQIDEAGTTFNFSGGLFQWAGGYISAGGNSPLLTNNGTINLVGSGNKEIDGGGFHNAGMMIQTGAGNLAFGGNSYMTNDATGTYDIRSDSGFANGDCENYGTFKKSAGNGISKLWGDNPDSTYFDLLGGTVEVDSGTLQLGRCYAGTGAAFIVAAGAVLDLNSGGIFGSYAGTYTGTGAGAVQINGGQISSASPGATFNFAGNLFQWNGGTIAAGPPFTNAGTMNLLGSGGWGIAGGGFVNMGTMIHSGSGALQWGNNAFMTNGVSGIYDIRMNGVVTNGGRIDNYGTLKKSSGNGIATMFNGDANSTYCDLLGGTVEVDTGTLQLGRGNNTGCTFIVASNAVLDLNSGGIFSGYSGSYTGTGAGQVQINTGQISIASPGATFNFAGNLFQWIGGTINACNPLDNQGTITIAGNVSIGCSSFTNHGTIKGNGNINGALTNDGTMAPGNSVGQLNFNGNLVLGSTSNLSFEIGGTAQGTTYDWLNKTDGGALTLNGTLTVRLINNFVPAASDTFTIVTTQAELQGAFGNVPSGGRLNTADGTGSFRVSYSVINDALLSQNVTLSDFQRSLTTPATDFNRDGKPDYVLFKASTRPTAIWYLNNNLYLSSASGPALPVGWNLVDIGDFNGDGKPDYLLFNVSTRQTAIWYMNNNVHVSSAFGPTLPVGWTLVAVGDFNRDGKPDYVLFKPSTRQTVIWYLHNNVYSSSAYGPTLPANWTIAGVADFNNDNKIDYLLFNPNTRQTVIWYLNNNAYVSAANGPTITAGYTLTGSADFNLDGKPDYVLFKASTRQTVIWYLHNNVYVSSAYGPTLPAGWILLKP
jgi:elongation factor P hydroxylase